MTIARQTAPIIRLADRCDSILQVVALVLVIVMSGLILAYIFKLSEFMVPYWVIGALLAGGVASHMAGNLVTLGVAKEDWMERQLAALSPGARRDAVDVIQQHLTRGLPVTRSTVYGALHAGEAAERARAQQSFLS